MHELKKKWGQITLLLPCFSLVDNQLHFWQTVCMHTFWCKLPDSVLVACNLR